MTSKFKLWWGEYFGTLFQPEFAQAAWNKSRAEALEEAAQAVCPDGGKSKRFYCDKHGPSCSAAAIRALKGE